MTFANDNFAFAWTHHHMTTVTARNQTMRLHENSQHGDHSPPILALHGWGQDRNSLAPLCDAIKTKLQTLHIKPPAFHVIDLPGFGLAPPPWQTDITTKPANGDPESGSWNTADYAHWVRAYCQKQGWSQVHLIGHSFGGRISLRMAAMWPELISSMALIGSAGLPARKSARNRLRTTLIKSLNRVCRVSPQLRAWHRARFGSKDYLDSGDMRRTLVQVVNEDQTSSLHKIKCPTFLLWGELDDAAPLDIGERLHRGITDSQLQVIPGQGHFPFLAAGQFGCAEAIGDFFAAGHHTGEPS